MKLITSEEISAPIEDVWAVLADLDGLEREAVSAGVALQRLARPGAPSWAVEFTFRDRLRKAEVQLSQRLAPEMMQFDMAGKSAEAMVRLELLPLSAAQCRLTVSTELRARSLPARLFVQSLKLARGTVMRRYESRIHRLAVALGERASRISA